MRDRTKSVLQQRAALLAAMLLVACAGRCLHAQTKPAETMTRFLVVDFTASDKTDESSWVGLAVSEMVRERLRRFSTTTAVSGMRTTAVLTRASEQKTVPPPKLAKTAELLGSDWVVSGKTRLDDQGRYEITLTVTPAGQPDQAKQQVVAGTILGPLIDRSVQAVFKLADVKVDPAELERVVKMTSGSDSALEYYAKAVRAVRRSKPHDALYYLAQSRRYQNDFRPATRLLGQVNLAAGNFREVLMIFERLLRDAQRSKDPVDEAFARTQIAISHQRAGNLEIAQKYYDSALEMSRQANLEDLEAMLLGAKATLSIDQKKKDEALRLLHERVKLLEKQGDRLAMGPACLTIALVLDARKQRDYALQYLETAAKLADEVGIPSDKAAALYQIGQLHKESGKLDEALTAYRDSLEHSREAEAGSAYREIADILETQGKLDEALAMLRKAEAVLSERKAYAQQADCLAKIARIQAKRNDHKTAMRTMTEAVEILSDLNHRSLAQYEKELSEMRAKAESQ